jgi:hypothetical protein
MFRTKGELVLLLVGGMLLILILGIYLWGISRLGGALRAAVGGGSNPGDARIEFHIKQAGDALRARGLIQ